MSITALIIICLFWSHKTAFWVQITKLTKQFCHVFFNIGHIIVSRTFLPVHTLHIRAHTHTHTSTYRGVIQGWLRELKLNFDQLIFCYWCRVCRVVLVMTTRWGHAPVDSCLVQSFAQTAQITVPALYLL